MKKKWIHIILTFVLTVSITGGTAYAWLTDKKELINEVGFMRNDTHIQEEYDPPEDPTPGQTIVKKPCMVNDSKGDVYVRIRVNFTDSDAESQCEPIKINEGWKLADDGYFYYDKKLAPDSQTETLFDEIVIKKSVRKEDLIPFDILVYGESVQAYGFQSARDAFDSL